MRIKKDFPFEEHPNRGQEIVCLIYVLGSHFADEAEDLESESLPLTRIIASRDVSIQVGSDR
jgi:hypothetical protein